MKYVKHSVISRPTYCITSRSSVIRLLVCQPIGPDSNPGLYSSELDITMGNQINHYFLIKSGNKGDIVNIGYSEVPNMSRLRRRNLRQAGAELRQAQDQGKV